MTVAVNTRDTTALVSQKPVQLQVNNSGAWKTVCRFDADDLEACDTVIEAAQNLQAVDAGLKFRIVTRDSLASVLMYFEKGEWRSAQ